jgi:hypothetical protein
MLQELTRRHIENLLAGIHQRVRVLTAELEHLLVLELLLLHLLQLILLHHPMLLHLHVKLLLRSLRH